MYTHTHRVEHLKAEAWRAFTRECDAEMAARIQRKNVQVLDRLSKIKEYQRDVLQVLSMCISQYVYLSAFSVFDIIMPASL